MVTIKRGVKLGGIHPAVVLAAAVCAAVYGSWKLDCTITSVQDGRHSPGSLHSSGRALDLRTNNVPEELRGRLRDAVALALGPEFDVVLEGDHLHIEFDPK